jgi:hypothetical protein
MPSVAPAARVSFVVEAVEQLERLQREMARLAPRDEHYESNRRALQAAIRDLRKMIARNVQ